MKRVERNREYNKHLEEQRQKHIDNEKKKMIHFGNYMLPEGNENLEDMSKIMKEVMIA